MQVLIATEETQGCAATDFSDALEGELVLYPRSDCDDPVCGCARGWSGMSSGRSTTTATVAERPGIDVDDLRAAILDALDRSGWVALIREIADLAEESGDTAWDDPDETIDAIIDEHVEVIEAICRRFDVGTVLRRHGADVHERVISSAA